jgi:hypothetical protein
MKQREEKENEETNTSDGLWNSKRMGADKKQSMIKKKKRKLK